MEASISRVHCDDEGMDMVSKCAQKIPDTIASPPAAGSFDTSNLCFHAVYTKFCMLQK